jgi:hypothetical protein
MLPCTKKLALNFVVCKCVRSKASKMLDQHTKAYMYKAKDMIDKKMEFS